MTDHGVVRTWGKDAASRIGATFTAVGATWSQTANYLTCVAAVLLVAVTVLSAVGVERKVVLAPGQISASSGSMYSADIKAGLLIAPRRDLNDAPRRSNLELFENGGKLGPPHSEHAEIAERGGGRYSHWGGGFGADQSVLFATSDGSDPRANGRTYTIRYNLYPTPVALGLSLALFLASITFAALFSGEPRSFFASIARTGIGGLKTSAFRWSLGVALVLLLTPVLLSKDVAVATAQATRAGSMDLAAILFGILAVRFLALEISAKRVGIIRAAVVAMILILFGTQVSGPELQPLQFGAIAGIAFSFAVYSNIYSYFLPVEQKISDFANLRIIALACSILTAINVLPELILYWDQSGWNDSSTYDRASIYIANGRFVSGDSYFMPIYQYGMALFYHIFGHDYRIQQIVNFLLSITTPCLMVYSAFIFSRSRLLATLVGLVVSVHPKLYHAVWYTQIENWYIPIFALSIWLVAVYLERPNLIRVALLALGAAAVLNTRLQGAFYAVALGLTVFVPLGARTMDRLRHAAAFGLVFLVIGVLPWSLRNHFVGGEFGLSTTQSAAGPAILNDPRIGFYGLRYGDNYNEIGEEWAQRFPDPAERSKAQKAYFRDRLLSDPMWFVEAFQWRFLAFFGLAPWTVWAPGGPQPFDLTENWRPYLQTVHYFLPLLLASVLGVALSITSRIGLFLTVLIGSNVFVAFLVGSGEPRLSYPVILLEILVGIAVFFRSKEFDSRAPDFVGRTFNIRRNAWSALVILASFAFVGTLVHWNYGQDRLYRPVQASYRSVDPAIRIDQSLPTLVWNGDSFTVSGKTVDSLEPGSRFRGYLWTTAKMFPPLYAGIQSGLPASAVDPRTPRFFTSTLMKSIPPKGHVLPTEWVTDRKFRVYLPVRFAGVEGSRPLTETMYIEAELQVFAEGALSPTGYWFDVLKYRVVSSAEESVQ